MTDTPTISTDPATLALELDAMLYDQTRVWEKSERRTIFGAASALRAIKAQAALLVDPNAVHLNMLRGTIARPSVEQIRHLYGPAIAAEKEAQAAPAGDLVEQLARALCAADSGKYGDPECKAVGPDCQCWDRAAAALSAITTAGYEIRPRAPKMEAE
jgi:hypothetical protein